MTPTMLVATLLLAGAAAGQAFDQSSRTSAPASAPRADVLVAEAMARARAESKAVFVDFGASWCGPCRALDGFLAAPTVAPAIESNFVVLKLTEWERGALAARNNPGAEALADKWGGGNGIPFYVILAADGRVLGTGTGFPGNRRSALRFLDLLERSAPALAGKPHDVMARALAERSDGMGALDGRVIDGQGRAVSGATVTVHGRAFLDGVWKPVRLARATTDGNGHYSADVMAGDLIVAVEPPAGSGFAPVTFHPSATSAARATVIGLDAGEGRTGIDVALAPGTRQSIAGTVIGSDGRPLPGAAVSITSLDWPSITFGTSADDAGRFAFAAAPAGRYTMWARGERAASGTRRQTEGGAATVDTTTGASAPVRLIARPPLRLTGRLVFDGPAMSAADRAAVRVAAVAPAAPQGVPSGLPQSAVGADGSFSVISQHSARVIRVNGLPAGWMLRSVTRGGVEVTDRALPAGADEDVSDLIVTVAAPAGTIAGRLVNADGTPHRGGVVIVFARESARWAYPSRFVRRGVVQDDGTFTVTPLPPGEYLIVGLPTAERNWDAPESLEALRADATAVTMVAGERQVVSVQLKEGAD